MCGLVGMVGYLEPFKHKNVMKDLMFLNALRGIDSTGLSVVTRERGVITRKMTVPSYEFIQYPAVDRAMSFGDQVWLAHSRYKTTGDVSRANAHPFEVLDDNGDILLVGAHNGTLNNKYEIERALGGEKYDTDSEALFNLLVEAPNFKEAINSLRGAWSLVWWDPTTNCLHFCRNNQRPMHFAWSKDHKVLLWGSEPWWIINAARRNGMELDKNDRGLSCYSTIEDMLYTIEIPQGRDQPLPDIKREGGYSGAPGKVFQNGFQRFKEWWDDDPNFNDAPGKEEEKKGTKETETVGAKKEVVTLGYPSQDSMRGFEGSQLSLKDFAEIKKKGCVWCKENFAGDRKFAFLNEDSLVCLDCIHDHHPKGDCVRPGEEDFIDPDEDFDDDLPFELGPAVKNSPEYKRVMEAAAAKSAAKTVG